MASKQAQFEALIQTHSGIVYRVVHTYCRQAEDQQDLTQEIKLQLWRAFDNYDERRVFSTWMYRICLNTAISWTRRTSMRNSRTIAFEDIEERAGATDFNEESQMLHRLIDELDPMNRALLLLYLEELSYAEIGEILGITANNVATKISRLRERFRQETADPDPTHN